MVLFRKIARASAQVRQAAHLHERDRGFCHLFTVGTFVLRIGECGEGKFRYSALPLPLRLVRRSSIRNEDGIKSINDLVAGAHHVGLVAVVAFGGVRTGERDL